MALDETRLLAFAKVASALPLSDIVAAAQDPTNLGKVAADQRSFEDAISRLRAEGRYRAFADARRFDAWKTLGLAFEKAGHSAHPRQCERPGPLRLSRNEACGRIEGALPPHRKLR
jgi:hypothetical protein